MSSWYNTEGVERRGVLYGGGSAPGDLNVKSNGVWVGGGGRTEGENVPVAWETAFNFLFRL